MLFLLGQFFFYYYRSGRSKDVCEIMLVKKDGKRKDMRKVKRFHVGAVLSKI